MRLRRPSTGTILGSVALFVALGGTALAATGQLVNIADGTNAANIAKVDSTGALRTTGTTTVLNVPAPVRPFSVTGYVTNAYSVGYTALTPATSATIAINRIVVGDDNTRPDVRDVLLYYAAVNAGQECNPSGGFAALQTIGRYTVPANGTVVDAMPTGRVLKAASGQRWCLLAGGFPTNTANGGRASITVSGWVVSGTPPAGTASASAERLMTSPQPK